MTTLQEPPTIHEVPAFMAPATPPTTFVAANSTSEVGQLPNSTTIPNKSIEHAVPLDKTEHDKPLTSAEAKKTLDEYAKAILDAHQNAENSDRLSKKSGRDAITSAIKAGEYLVQAKELVGHGNWLPWLKKNCIGISDKTAQRYMTLAKFDNVSDSRNQQMWTKEKSPLRC